MRKCILGFLLALLSLPALGDSLLPSDGLAGGGGATESVGGDTRPVSETDRFIVGDHSDPDIILDPTTRSIDIKAHATDGGCSELKESVAGGDTYSLTTCVEDDMSADLYCVREGGYFVGHGCQGMGFSAAAFGGGIIITTDLGTTDTVGNGDSPNFSSVIGMAGGDLETWPLYPGWIKFNSIGKYDVVGYVNGASQNSLANKCLVVSIQVNGTNVTIDGSPAAVNHTWDPQAQPTSVATATRAIVSATVDVPDLLGDPGATLKFDGTAGTCTIGPTGTLRMYDTVDGSPGLLGTYLRALRTE